MPITPEKKQQLVEILNDLSDVERVRIAGAVYDSLVAADLPWADMFVVSKCIADKVTWGLLPSEFGKIQVMFIRSVDETLLKVLPDLVDKSPEVKQALADAIKGLSGTELVKIASTAYDSFVAAELDLQKSFAVSKHVFAKIPWRRLPKGMGNIQVMIIKGVTEKLIKTLPDLIEIPVQEATPEAPPEVAAEAPPAATTNEATGTQSTIAFQEVSPVSGAGITITASPPITAATRSEIDDLDESASMHGMDTESPPEGGQAPQEEVRVDAAEEDPSTIVDEEPVSEDEGQEEDEDDSDEEPVSASSEENGHPKEPDAPHDVATSPESNGHVTDAVATEVVAETTEEPKPEEVTTP